MEEVGEDCPVQVDSAHSVILEYEMAQRLTIETSSNEVNCSIWSFPWSLSSTFGPHGQS